MNIVELENGVWLAPWDGDPGRTLRIENAKTFASFKDAEDALKMAREWRQFVEARILPKPAP